MNAEHEHDERKNATGQWHEMRISGREGKRRHHQGRDAFCDTPNLTFAKPKRHYPFAPKITSASLRATPLIHCLKYRHSQGTPRAAHPRLQHHRSLREEEPASPITAPEPRIHHIVQHGSEGVIQSDEEELAEPRALL